MTLKEWMRGFITLNAPFDQLRVCEAVTGKTINNISIGEEIYIPSEILDRKIVSWAVLKRPYRFIVAVEYKPEKRQMRNFLDIETGDIITEQLLAETLELLKEDDDYKNITLAQYINNCLTINNGTLEEL